MKPKPFSLKNAPSLIERAWPAQKISVESYKEQKAVVGKTLTALGSYWKGRKPLVLNRACILGALLPAGEDLEKDLEIFEMLMGMDELSMRKRLKNKKANPKTFREWVIHSERAENCDPEKLHSHIWEKVNQHLGTSAQSIPELIEQLGIMRFGHRPKVCDPFCGSGQIPFEAARMGCDVYASDLNPIACMLTWGALHIVGAPQERREKLLKERKKLIDQVRSEMDALNFEADGKGRKAKAYLYCCECTCPITGWTVPMMPSFVISEKRSVIARLVPDVKKRCYDLEIVSDVSKKEMAEAKKGTIQGELLMHPKLDGRSAATIPSIRGDYQNENGDNRNHLRRWKKTDIVFTQDDIFHERLYCIQWQNENGSTEFCSVTKQDLQREEAVIHYVKNHLVEWQAKGWVPNDEIKAGCKTDEPIRTRGWTHWHHLFNPRQLLLLALVNKHTDGSGKIGMGRALDYSSRLCHWDSSMDSPRHVFYNQALNTFWNYCCRSSILTIPFLNPDWKSFPLSLSLSLSIGNHPANQIPGNHDIIITDPPYGDAVMYEEITEFFITWLRKNPPKEFSDWIWDSRRALAISGKDETFRQGMINGFEHLTRQMTDNGIQILMFTHQSGSIWTDLAQIIWASGLQVTAAWYVATETDSGLKKGKGNYVKGTVILILRKRSAYLSAFSDELATEIKDEVLKQHETLTGLNQKVKRPEYADENLFADADLKMAGYAAALRVLTNYSEIDGQDMVREAKRPRKKGEKTVVDRLIAWAADLADERLVPEGLQEMWKELMPSERFYLKMLDLETQGQNTLDNYQNFAKAYHLPSFKQLMANTKANQARLKSSVEFGKTQLTGGEEFDNSPLRAVLYALWQLDKEVDGDKILKELRQLLGHDREYVQKRPLLITVTDFLAQRLDSLRKEEASHARVLKNLIRNERIG